MATAREESGYGSGGKFKKRPFRRQTTPYDRPSTALRNPPSININTNNNGWLSRLVDPAQRLIVSSAHRLFASVFPKRLPPPSPPPAEPEENNEDKDMDQEQASADRPDGQGAINGHDDLNNNSDKGGLTELEQILKQKTFSRSEIDRLTALLQSRTTDIPVGDEQKSPEVIPSNPVVLCSRKEVSVDTPVKENGIGSQLISTPVMSSIVRDEDIASPAELAKAYMVSRPSKVSPSMLGVRGQAFREESTVLNNQSFPAASAAVSLVPRSSGYVGVSGNGFVTPRTRGRSAIYSMARTPYSRVHSTSTFKGAGLAIDSVTGPSSSQSTWEKNRLTDSKPVSLKRRSTVLDSDIGPVGPTRRIRQRPNILSLKNWSLSATGSPIPVQRSGASDAIQYPSSSQQTPLLSGQPKHSFTKMLTENGANSVPSTSSTIVSSKSSEVASKILQQLDMLVSSREKSPTKLSPSMLRGPALKSLENVDSSIFLENVQDYNKVNGSLDTSSPDVRDTTSQKLDKIDENGPTKFVSASDKSILAMNGIDATGIIKDNVPWTKTTDTTLTNSIAYPHPQKKQAFLMSAHEDYLDLDDDDYSNGPASIPLADGRDKPNSSSDNKAIAAEAITITKSPSHSDVKPPNPVLNKISDEENNDGAVVTGESPVFTFSTVPSPSMTAQPAEVAIPSTLTSNKAANESSVAPVFSFGEKVAAPKESNAVSPIFSTSTANVDKEPQFNSAFSSTLVSETSSFVFSDPLNTKSESSTSFASIAVGARDSVTKVPESDEADNKVFFRTPETSLPSAACTSSPTASIFSVEAPANSSTLNNGSVASFPSSTSSPSLSLFSGTGFNQNLFSSSTTSFATSKNSATSLTTTSVSMPSAAASIFKFGSSAVPSASSLPISATSGVESTEAKKNDTAFGNSTNMVFEDSSAFAGAGSSTSNATSLAYAGTGSNIFGGTSLAFTTGSSVFGGVSSPLTSTSSSSFGGTSTVTNPSTSIFGFSAGTSASATATGQGQASNPFSASSAQASVNATGVATTTQSMPTQFGSSTLSASFGLAGNSTISSSSSPFGSSTSAVKPFGSTPFGVSSSTSSSEANSISSSSGGTTTGVFGASGLAPKTSPLFGSTFNSTSPSTVFSFGASASSAASSSMPVFGPSTNGSSSSIFPFSSAAATSSQIAFGNANPVFTFGSAPSNNNDQMSMEDSMAEDTVPSSIPAIPAPTPAITAFGQQPVSPPSSFVFSSVPPSGANPFQFGSQPNMATPQNHSPFQASSSLDFNAGGSFSLGTGGGDKSQRKIVKLNRKPRKK